MMFEREKKGSNTKRNKELSYLVNFYDSRTQQLHDAQTMQTVLTRTEERMAKQNWKTSGSILPGVTDHCRDSQFLLYERIGKPYQKSTLTNNV